MTPALSHRAVRILCFAIVSAASLAPAWAADPAVSLRQSLEASGGAAWRSVARLHVRYSVEQSGQRGWEDDWTDVRTGRYASETRLAPYVQRGGFDGISPWTSTPDGLAYVQGDADSLLGAANASYRNALGWWFGERHPATIADGGARSEHGRAFDLVDITPAGGRPFTLWIDHATHLIDRFVEQQAESVTAVRYEDYRWVHGLRVPYTLRVGDGGEEPSAIQRVQSLEIDPPIGDRRYALPSPVTSPAASGAVTVPIRLIDNIVLVDVTIDGHGPYEADFDTGGELMLTPAVVSELRLASSGQWKEGGGGEGFVMSSAGSLREIAIGAAKVQRPVFTVHEFDPSAPKRILIGAEFLQRYVVRLDFDAMTMTLTPPARFDYRGPGAVVPFHFQSNQPEISGFVDGIAGSFAVDTGDDGSLLLIAEFARKYRLIERYRAELPYGGMAMTATRGVYARAHTVELNGADGRPLVSVSRPITRISTQTGGFDANRYVSANLGVGILEQFNVTFDYSRRHIIFERNHRYGAAERFNRSGMKVGHEPGAWKVVELFAGKPAARAGLRVGDIVVKLGGHPAAALTHDTIDAMLTQAVGTVIDVIVRRGAEEVAKRITLEEVLVDGCRDCDRGAGEH